MYITIIWGSRSVVLPRDIGAVGKTLLTQHTVLAASSCCRTTTWLFQAHPVGWWWMMDDGVAAAFCAFCAGSFLCRFPSKKHCGQSCVSCIISHETVCVCVCLCAIHCGQNCVLLTINCYCGRSVFVCCLCVFGCNTLWPKRCVIKSSRTQCVCAVCVCMGAIHCGQSVVL